MEPAQLIKLLPPIENKLTVLHDNAINGDIINAMLGMIPGATAEVKQMAPKFKRETTRATAFAIWQFLRNRAKYVRDTNDLQLIRTPKRFIFDTHKKNNSGDCKSFALFTVSVLRSLGLPAFLQFSGYIPGKQMPSHVYAFTKDKNGKKIIIDGCYVFFDREKKYSFTKIYDTMKVASLSGIEGNKARALAFYKALPKAERKRIKSALCKRHGVNPRRPQYGGRVSGVINGGAPVIYGVVNDNVISKKLSKEEKAKRKAKRKAKVKKGLKKFGRGVAFITLGIGRGAYLALVALNVNAFASKMKMLQNEKDKKNPKKTAFDTKIIPFWKKIGGLPKLLTKAIAAGAKHKPLFLSKKAKAKYQKLKGVGSCEYIGDLESINAIPVAAAAAAAIPVIAAIIPVMIKAFAGLGKKKEAGELADTGKELVQEQQQTPGFAQAAANLEPGAGAELQDGQPGEEIEGINGADWGELFSSLGKVAAVGVERIGAAIHKKKKKNPKAFAAVEKVAQAGDDYFTGAYMRQTGTTARLKQASSFADQATKYLPFAALGLGALYFLKSKK